MKTKHKPKNILNAAFAITIVIAMICSTTTVISYGQIKGEIQVDIGGPYKVDFGEDKTFDATVTGGSPPYSCMWYWGDGSAGNSNTHAFYGNEASEFTVVLTVQDAKGKLGTGSTRVSAEMPTDNTAIIEKFVKKEDSPRWSKIIHAEVGDILNVKIVVYTKGSDVLNLTVSDESSEEFSYIEGSVNIEPDIFYPGGEDWGPVFVWNLLGISPEMNPIVITYDVQVIKEFSSPAVLDEFALNGAMVYAFLNDSEKIGPAGIIASDEDYIRVKIEEAIGNVYYVDDDGSAEFSCIQEAIDVASDGDVIIVRSGIYVESLDIDKSVKVIGRGIRKPVINGDFNATGSSSAIGIYADKVTIKGFTICNALKSGIYIDSDRNVVSDNRIIKNGLEGVYIHSGEHNIIKHNTISANGRGVIILSKYNLILENTIQRNTYFGISVDGEATANDIYQNNFIKNGLANAVDHNFFGNHWTHITLPEKKWTGNYWSDYNGEDTDGDGLGDTPYTSTSIYSAGIVLDLYPRTKPYHPIVPTLILSEMKQ